MTDDPSKRKETGSPRNRPGELLRIRGNPPRPAFLAIAIATFAIAGLAWFLLAWSGRFPAAILPSPGAVVRALGPMFGQDGVLEDVVRSVLRVGAGFLLSVAIAVPLGLLAGTFALFDAIVEPINDFVRYLPVVALVPLTILWIGLGDDQKVAIIFIGTFFQLLVMVADKARSVPRQMIEVAQTLGYGRAAIVVHVILRYSLPQIYDDCRVCLGWAWSYLVVAEMVAATKGLGFVIIQAQRYLQTDKVMAGIVLIGVIGLVFDYLFRIPRRWLFPWAPR